MKKSSLQSRTRANACMEIQLGRRYLQVKDEVMEIFFLYTVVQSHCNRITRYTGYTSVSFQRCCAIQLAIARLE